MVEEMQRASIRSRIDSMTVELEDDQLLLACIHSAFVELGDNIQRDIVNTPASNFMIGDGHENLLNSSHYLPAIISVVNFAKSVKGFQLLYQNDRVQLLKVTFSYSLNFNPKHVSELILPNFVATFECIESEQQIRVIRRVCYSSTTVPQQLIDG